MAASWEELSREGYAAARQLFDAGLLRSSVSRAYFAAYSAVTAHLVRRGVTFARGRGNPPHETLHKLAQAYLPLPGYQRKWLVAIVRRLRVARVEADYIPTSFLDRKIGEGLLHDAAAVLRLLNIPEE